MEDDDETQSQSSPGSPSNGRISVTVAAPSPPLPPLAIALPAQIPRSNGSGSASGAGGSREDCWSEGATSVLIDAWGERYLQLSRGNLKQQHWKEVADIVGSREDYGKTLKTDVQCKNRIDTVKKKYKAEKARILAGGPPSRWPFFHRLDHLLGSSHGAAPAAATIRSTRIQNQKLKKKKSKRGGFYDSDSEPDPPSPDSTDSLPPETYPYKRARTQREFNSTVDFSPVTRAVEGRQGGGWGDSVRELTRAIVKFGEMYEKAESSKLQQMMEMEKQRMKFAKELEMQRMQFFMKTQVEISQLKQRSSSGDRNNSHHRHHHHSNNNHINNNHHSDSSS